MDDALLVLEIIFYFYYASFKFAKKNFLKRELTFKHEKEKNHQKDSSYLNNNKSAWYTKI